MERSAPVLAEQPKRVAGRVEREEPLAVDEVDGAGRVDAERQPPPAARQRQGDVAQGAVPADRADVAGLLSDLDRMGRAAFGQEELSRPDLDPAGVGSPARHGRRGAVLEELDGGARHGRL